MGGKNPTDSGSNIHYPYPLLTLPHTYLGQGVTPINLYNMLDNCGQMSKMVHHVTLFFNCGKDVQIPA